MKLWSHPGPNLFTEVGHQTESLYPMAETVGSFLQQEVETVPILVDKKDRLASVTAENDVVESAGEMNAWFPCYGENTPDFFKLPTSRPDPINISDGASLAGNLREQLALMVSCKVQHPCAIKNCAVSRGNSGPDRLFPRFTTALAPRRPMSLTTDSSAGRFP